MPNPITRHASPNPGSVNARWLETPSGILVVDAQRQLSQAALADAVAARGKPVAAILLTHAHPDHVGGLPALRRAFPGAPVIASSRTAEIMRTDEGGLLALTRSFLGDDFAADLPAPDVLLPEDGSLRLAGLDIRHLEAGPGETTCATIFLIPEAGVAFVGDVVANGMTPWLVEGHSAAWLEQIGRVDALLPADTLAYPGHGPAAAFGPLAAAQRDYLRRFRALVSEAGANGRFGAEPRAAVIAETERRYPGWQPVAGVPDLLGLNADAIARELGLAQPTHP